MKKVCIIGGGFSGLSLAYYLSRAGVKVELFEKSDRLGGLISTLSLGWGKVETAASGLIGSPLVDDLIHELDLEYADRPNQSTRARYVFRERPRKWPLRVGETLRLTQGLSKIGLHRALNGVRNAGNETSGAKPLGITAKEWVSRQFGASAFDYLIGPALQGVLGTDDVAADTLLDYVRGMRKKGRSKGQNDGFKNGDNQKRYPRGTVSPKQGMGDLILALSKKVEELGCITHLNTAAEWRDDITTVIAAPAYVAAGMVSERLPELAHELAKIQYLPLTTATVAFSQNDGHDEITNGFGCLFPKSEKFNALGVLFSSSIFDRPHDGEIETWLFGGPQASDEIIINKICIDRARLLRRIAGGNEVHRKLLKNFKITHWSRALPHYDLSTSEVLRKVPRILADSRNARRGHGAGLYLTGNYLGEIGLGRILARNFELARQIASDI